MKKAFLSGLLITLCMIAGAKVVKFTVDMGSVEVDPTGVYVYGDFQDEAGFGSDWDSNDACKMTNIDGTTQYYLYASIPANKKYEFIFVNSRDWYNPENAPSESSVGFVDGAINSNRWFYLDSLTNDTTIIGPIPYCGNSTEGLNLVRLRVSIPEEITVNDNGIHIESDFPEWDQNANMMYSFSNNIYEKIVYIPSGNYKFRFLNGTTDSETVPESCASDGFRTLTVNNDTVLNAVIFSSCEEVGLQTYTNKGNINIYPNPCSENATITSNTPISKIEILNIEGKNVSSKKHNNTSNANINVQNLKQGIYFIKITNIDNTTEVHKLIKK